MTEATIETGALEVVAGTGRSEVTLPVFAFSYHIGTDYYSGRFALLPYLTDPGESILSRMIGRTLQVRYDPLHPEKWFLPVEIIEGCKVEQKLGPHVLPLYPED